MRIFFLLACAMGWIVAGSPGDMSAEASGNKTVVELFTSQSCYSCPPAEAYLGELVERGDVIALEFHVDYWDDLVYGAAGRWKDVFSSPANTDRQRVYNRNIRGAAQVYTPQMVVDGRVEAAGTRRGAVESAIAGQARDQRSRLDVAVARTSDGGLTVAIDGPLKAPALIWLARFERARVTRVKAGENEGKILANHHVVTGMERIGAWSGAAMTATVPGVALSSNEGCAVLVQSEAQGPILGAAECPAPRIAKSSLSQRKF
jgi:hypothetical protein